MPWPETFEQSVEAALLGVELDPDDLGVAGGTGAHVLVTGIVQETLGVPDLGLRHPRDSLEGQLDPPEATRSELRELLSRGRNVVVRALRNWGVPGGLCGPRGAEAELVQEVHGGCEWFGERPEGSLSGLGERIKEGFAERGAAEAERWGGGGGGGGRGGGGTGDEAGGRG